MKWNNWVGLHYKVHLISLKSGFFRRTIMKFIFLDLRVHMWYHNYWRHPKIKYDLQLFYVWYFQWNKFVGEFLLFLVWESTCSILYIELWKESECIYSPTTISVSNAVKHLLRYWWLTYPHLTWLVIPWKFPLQILFSTF